MEKKKTHEPKRRRSENLMNWIILETKTWLKKKKRTPRINCEIFGKDLKEQIEAANILLSLKYGHDYQNADQKTSSNSSLSSNIIFSQQRRCLENHPNPVLPLNFKTKIHQLTGSDETEMVFVFEKTLFKSDVSVGENRFLIPLRRIQNEFLTEEEKRRLETKTTKGIPKMEVELIQPSLEVCPINLKKWNMGDSSKKKNKEQKKKKKTSENYVLVTSWNTVVKENELTVGSIVQLWSFRKEGQLCFALVKQDSDSNSDVV